MITRQLNGGGGERASERVGSAFYFFLIGFEHNARLCAQLWMIEVNWNDGNAIWIATI